MASAGPHLNETNATGANMNDRASAEAQPLFASTKDDATPLLSYNQIMERMEQELRGEEKFEKTKRRAQGGQSSEKKKRERHTQGEARCVAEENVMLDDGDPDWVDEDDGGVPLVGDLMQQELRRLMKVHGRPGASDDKPMHSRVPRG